MYNGPNAGHADSSAPESAPNEGEYRAPTEYAPFPEKDGYDSDERKYGAIEQRAFEIHVSSPVDEVETLFHRTHLTAQFHKKNKDYWEKGTPYANNGGMLYDLAVLDLFEEKLKCEDIDISDLDVSERRLKALFLRMAREQSGKELIEHLKESSSVQLDVHSEIGYDEPSDIPTYDTFQREFRKLQRGEEIRPDAFDAAVTRTVYSVYRAGIVPPEAVKESYNFDDVEPPLNEKSVSRETKKEELRSFVNLLLDTTIDPLTFGRDADKTKHDMKAFIGAFAASALFDCGLETLKDVCDWNYPRGRVPGGGWLNNYITNQLESDIDLTDFGSDPDADLVRPIDEQFNLVHNRTLTLARTLGFWSESNPLNLGVDMFRIDWTGESLDATVGRPPKAGNEAVTEQWTYVIAGGIDTESRFVLGGRWLADMGDYPTAVKEILSNSFDIVDLNTIFIDSEIVGGDLIDTLRRFVDDDWVIRAPDKGVFKGLRRLTPSNTVGFARDVTWNIRPKPNAVTYPYDGDEPATIEIDPDNVLVEAIRDEDEGERIPVPLASSAAETTTSQTSIDETQLVPRLTETSTDLEALSGVGDEASHVAYLTDRSLPEHSAAAVRFPYIQRWAIEASINQITNHFMPEINSKDPNQRLFGVHIAILFYNWHTLINRCLSPRGLRLDVSYQELLQAIQHVCFSEESKDNN